MADFPTLPTIARGTSERWRDPKIVSLTRANSVKARMTSTGRKLDLSLHLWLKGAAYETLRAFYDANRAITFNYIYSREVNGVLVVTNHTMIFGPNDIDLPMLDIGQYECNLELIEV